jgi:transcriptional regulator with GAF, ATPase, and Fis domain
MFKPPGQEPRIDLQKFPDGIEESELEIMRKDGQLHWVAIKRNQFRDASGEAVGTVLAVSSIHREKNLEFENEFLQDEVRANFGSIIGGGPALNRVLSQVATVAPTEANVLIQGESGTGKELIARAIHDMSARKGHPLVRVNCASIPKELFESEFFGHVRGAFTGAVRDRVGRFELADHGTLFLDEIGEIPLGLQSKLLRVLQEGQFERLGDDRTRTVRVRVITATNRDLDAEVKAGHFRLDLYYRLSVFPIVLPPLRERKEDISALAAYFIQQSARRLGVPEPHLAKAYIQQLQAYDWPGNVRELQNVLERALILARNGVMKIDLPAAASSHSKAPKSSAADDDETLSLDELDVRERQILTTALERCRWKIYSDNGAAALLRIKPTTLMSKMKRFGLTKKRE